MYTLKKSKKNGTSLKIFCFDINHLDKSCTSLAKSPTVLTTFVLTVFFFCLSLQSFFRLFAAMFQFNLWVVLIFSTVIIFPTDGKAPITIQWNESIEFGQLFYFEQYSIPRNQMLEIQLELNNTKYYENFGFAIIQIHSFLDNVTVVEDGKIKNTLSGTNVGVKTFENLRLSVINPLYYTRIQVAIAVVVYSKYSPVPGGCAMEVNENLALNLTLKKFTNMIQTDVHLAGNIPILHNSNYGRCDNLFHTYKFYYKYLPQWDLSASTYFRIVKEMIDVTSIKNKGSVASKHINGPSNRRNFVDVPGTGVVYNAIVYDSIGGVAAYVPVVTYSCHPVWAKNDCYLIPITVEWTIPALFLIIVGLIHVFVVLENRSRELFYHSYAIGIYISICLIASFDDLKLVGRFGMVIFSGLSFALFICALCHKFNITLAALDLTSKLILSWILSIVIHYLLNDNAHFGKDWIYWTTFFVIILLSMLCLLLTRTCSENGNSNSLLKLVPTIANVIVSANAFLLGLQILIRSNMMLILFNHMHSIMDKEFKSANGIVNPTAKDLCIFIAMPVLVIIGVFFQSKKIIVFKSNENSTDSIKVKRSKSRSSIPVQRRWGNGSDSVFDSPTKYAPCCHFFEYLHKKRGRLYTGLP